MLFFVLAKGGECDSLNQVDAELCAECVSEQKQRYDCWCKSSSFSKCCK